MSPIRTTPIVPLEFKPDQLYRVPTDDGAFVVLGRYRARGGAQRFAEPVVLGHSLGTNRFNLDFDERYSLARALARQGFEAWVLELRGHGISGSGEGSSFDVEAIYDVGAAIKAVLSTGASHVHWVGHSRGGLLAYAHLARFPTAPIRSVVTMGSAVSFRMSPGLQPFVDTISPLLRVPSVPLRLPALAAASVGMPVHFFNRYFLRVKNTEHQVIHQALAHVVADIPGGVARQFARWVRDDVFDGEDGFDYRKHMRSISVPILAVAGSEDFLSTPVGVTEVRSLVDGPVDVRVFGKRSGDKEDYGHGDLVIGRWAPDEVFPVVAAFLARHSVRLIGD